jgi:outer membrane biosynthesis protein TonB
MPTGAFMGNPRAGVRVATLLRRTVVALRDQLAHSFSCRDPGQTIKSRDAQRAPRRQKLRQGGFDVLLIGKRERSTIIRDIQVLGASLLLVLMQTSACARVKSEPPRAATAPRREEQQTPVAPPLVEPSQPKPAEPAPKVTEQPPTATEPPKPDEPAQSKAARPSQPKPPAPAPPRPPESPRPRQSAAPPPLGPERAAIVDLTALEQRLTGHQCDRCVHQAGAQERGRRPARAIPRVPRRAWRDDARKASRDVTIFWFSRWCRSCQDKDPPLARDISTSREALWNLLVDPTKFKTLKSDPPGQGERPASQRDDRLI